MSAKPDTKKLVEKHGSIVAATEWNIRHHYRLYGFADGSSVMYRRTLKPGKGWGPWHRMVDPPAPPAAKPVVPPDVPNDPAYGGYGMQPRDWTD